jgi:hypothetical protein
MTPKIIIKTPNRTASLCSKKLLVDSVSGIGNTSIVLCVGEMGIARKETAMSKVRKSTKTGVARGRRTFRKPLSEKAQPEKALPEKTRVQIKEG